MWGLADDDKISVYLTLTLNLALEERLFYLFICKLLDILYQKMYLINLC